MAVTTPFDSSEATGYENRDERVLYSTLHQDNYQNRRTHSLRYAAENLAVKDLLDYIMKKNYIYPKELESYEQLKREIDIEKTALGQESQRKKKAIKKALKNNAESVVDLTSGQNRQNRKTSTDRSSRKNPTGRSVNTSGAPSTTGATRKSNMPSWDNGSWPTQGSGTWMPTKPRSSYSATGGAWGGYNNFSNSDNDRNAILPPIVYGGSQFGDHRHQPTAKVYNHVNPWEHSREQTGPSQWAGTPGATSWNTEKKVLYPPPSWAISELQEMTDGVKNEMAELFKQSWFLELAGDAQRIAWYNKLTQVKPKYAHEEQAQKMLKENERKFRDAQESAKTKKILDDITKKAKEKKKGGYANEHIKIKDFNWKELSKYNQIEMEAKIDEIEREIVDNKNNFNVWKQQCHQWERKMRESGFLSENQQKKITDTAREWKKMEVKFIQVEEKKKSQIEYIHNEVAFRNVPAPPKFFSEDLFNRPVSPIPERVVWERERSPSPDLELIRAAVRPLISQNNRPVSAVNRELPRSPERRRRRSRSRSRSRERRKRRRGRGRSHSRSPPRKRAASNDSDVIEVTSTTPQINPRPPIAQNASSSRPNLITLTKSPPRPLSSIRDEDLYHHEHPPQFQSYPTSPAYQMPPQFQQPGDEFQIVDSLQHGDEHHNDLESENRQQGEREEYVRRSYERETENPSRHSPFPERHVDPWGSPSWDPPSTRSAPVERFEHSSGYYSPLRDLPSSMAWSPNRSPNRYQSPTRSPIYRDRYRSPSPTHSHRFDQRSESGEPSRIEQLTSSSHYSTYDPSIPSDLPTHSTWDSTPNDSYEKDPYGFTEPPPPPTISTSPRYSGYNRYASSPTRRPFSPLQVSITDYGRSLSPLRYPADSDRSPVRSTSTMPSRLSSRRNEETGWKDEETSSRSLIPSRPSRRT